MMGLGVGGVGGRGGCSVRQVTACLFCCLDASFLGPITLVTTDLKGTASSQGCDSMLVLFSLISVGTAPGGTDLQAWGQLR